LKTAIIGYGEIGKALERILSKEYLVKVFDKNTTIKK